ncbi:hypothetical protein SNEBB_004984 [Seison nebaliae]|nr:hypothetical protein SNEBB_004984 [Seison nebaliae]
MADDILSRVGLYMDEVNKLRLMDPEKATQTNELKEECDNFVSNIDEFQQLVTRFMKQIDDVAKEVNKQKMRVSNWSKEHVEIGGEGEGSETTGIGSALNGEGDSSTSTENTV